MARKNQIAQITPDEFGYAMTAGQKGYQEYLLGFVQQFQPGRPVPVVGLGMNNKISTDLSPFKVEEKTINIASNIAPYPDKFRYLALMTDPSGKKVDWISDNKLPGRMNSVIDPPTDTGKCWYNEAATGWHVYPNGQISSVIVNYYVKPDDVVWGYDIVGGRPVYNQAKSVNPQFNDSAMTEVLGRACKILGLSFQSENLVQFGMEVINKGE